MAAHQNRGQPERRLTGVAAKGICLEKQPLAEVLVSRSLGWPPLRLADFRSVLVAMLFGGDQPAGADDRHELFLVVFAHGR